MNALCHKLHICINFTIPSVVRTVFSRKEFPPRLEMQILTALCLVLRVGFKAQTEPPSKMRGEEQATGQQEMHRDALRLYLCVCVRQEPKTK